MEIYSIRGLTFTYPGRKQPALVNIDLDIQEGQFVTLCGKSGCGKSTLLRQLKPILTPHGTCTGELYFAGRVLNSLSQQEQAASIGFVLQSPDNQIVTDKVWHELAFGLESLGYDTPTIRGRVAEMASFFGIQSWFHENISALSGGQKQLLNLAAIMSMQPQVLLLDEPTSQLDPIAATDFLQTLAKINRELGTTIIISEHRLEDVLPLSDRLIAMDEGRIIADGTAQEVAQSLKSQRHELFYAMPAATRMWAALADDGACPITVREGHDWLTKYAAKNILDQDMIPSEYINSHNAEPIIELKEVWFRYAKDQADILKGLSLCVYESEFFAILGGNGTGKTTALNLISGINKPHRGGVKINNQAINKIASTELFDGLLGVLPQNPQSLFVKKTVKEDLLEIFAERKIPLEQQKKLVKNVTKSCELEHVLQMHPYDLSGGEQQRAALAKILLLQPRILLLDEPTKGLDAHFKHKLAAILAKLQCRGMTIIMVSHDIEFCAQYADRCAMFFDGAVVSAGSPRKFFAGKSFYTTAANRLSRHLLPRAVSVEDIVLAGGGRPETMPVILTNEDDADILPEADDEPGPVRPEYCLQQSADRRKISKRTLLTLIMVAVIIPLTIYAGYYFLDDRKFYIISLLIIIEAIFPFVMVFEGRKPQARELVIIAVLSALTVAGRTAFFMLPQFKPVIAMVIIAGVCFGGEAGFLVGAVSAFVSNFFFGQGPWTPMQMFAFGLIGLLAGILFRKGLLQKRRAPLCVFGGLSAIIIYGGIMNPASVLMFQPQPTWQMFAASYAVGLPFDLIHAAATVFFLFFISRPLIEKLERVKTKYGLLEREKTP